MKKHKITVTLPNHWNEVTILQTVTTEEHCFYSSQHYNFRLTSSYNSTELKTKQTPVPKKLSCSPEEFLNSTATELEAL